MNSSKPHTESETQQAPVETKSESVHVHGPNCNHDNHHGHQHAQSLKPITREQPKVGRNDPCLCGSGKKYKKCCGN